MFNLSKSKNGNTKEFTLSGSLIVLFLASQKYYSHANTSWISVIAVLWMKTILLFQVRQLSNLWRQYCYFVEVEIQTWNKSYKYFECKKYYRVNSVKFPISGGTIVIWLSERPKLPQPMSKISTRKLELTYPDSQKAKVLPEFSSGCCP